MPTVVEMPRLSDTMREGTLAEWKKQEGEKIEAGDELADIETDKATMAFESFDSGVVLKHLIGPGDTVPLGTPICILGKKDEDVSKLAAELAEKVKQAMAEGLGEEPAPEPPVAKKQADEGEAPETLAEGDDKAEIGTGLDNGLQRAGDEAEREHHDEAAHREAARHGRAPAPRDAEGLRVKASPLARRIAADRGVDLTTVEGTGPAGRIIKRDVESLEPTRRVAAAAGAAPAAGAAGRPDQEVRVTQMRKTIARRLVEAKNEAPHYYLQMVVDCEKLVALRTELNDSQDKLKISFNDLVMRACVVALQDHPWVNAGWQGKTIKQFGGVQLGFAVAIEDGLITPVVRDAERKGLLQMAVEVRDLAERARTGQLEEREYQGNSFCVSNLGMYGIERFTAIINPPAACILAVGALRQEPVVKDGALAVGQTMALSLSCDHRVVDGATGAAFMKDLKQILEKPLNLLL